MPGQLEQHGNEILLPAHLGSPLNLRGVIEQLPLGVVVAEAPTGRLLLHNAEAERLWRHPVIAAAHVDDYAQYRGIHADGTRYSSADYPIQSALSGTAVRSHEMQYLRGDGTYAWFSVDAAPVRNLDGVIVAAVVTFTDITVRKEMERELREQHAQAASLAHALELTQTIIVDLNDVIRFWSEGAAQFYGYRAEEALGRRAHQLLRTIFPEPFVSIQAEVVENGHWSGELTHFRRDGQPVDVASKWVLHHEAVGAEFSIIQGNIDITARRRVEQELRRSNDDLAQFARVVSHDLKAPLRMVRTYSELLLRQCGDISREGAAEFLGYISESAVGMEALINGLLEFAQAADPELDAYRTVELSDALAKACTNLAVVIGGSGAVITNSDLPVIRGYPILFVQLFQNLISNAIKYPQPGVAPQIHIGSEREEEEWKIWVSDNGSGIPENQRERIFLPFKRLHGAEVPGSGIGLATCKRVVERHGGRIWVESEVGRGSKFVFTVPLNRPASK
jgi:PAS domain S-box-containing protein